MRWFAELGNRFGRTRWFNALIRWTLLPLDRLVERLTGGRRTFTEHLFPTLRLTHVGRRSGRRYETPLLYVRDDDGTPVVVGTNYGKPDHPSWSANLLENPETRIRVDDRTLRVRAEPVEDPSHRERIFGRFEDTYTGYRRYRQQVDRHIRMFRLERQEDQT